MKTNEFIKKRRHELGLSLSQVAEACDVNVGTVSRWENGMIKDMKASKIHALAKALKISPHMLIDDDPDYPTYEQGKRINLFTDATTEVIRKILSNERVVPVYDNISCGQGLMVDENAIDSIGLPTEFFNKSATYFANNAEGDSMEPKFHNGDLLIFEETPVVESGDIGAFSLNGEYYCKRFKRLPNDSVWLFSDNAAYDPIPIGPDDNFRVLGKYKMRLTRD